MSMLLNRRRVGKANPYVTDGLIAMFDGEWNAGLYKHSSNATEWVDLSGKSTFASSTKTYGLDGSGYSWGDKFLQLVPNTQFNFINYLWRDAINSDSLSVELVCTPLSIGTALTYNDVIWLSPSTISGLCIRSDKSYKFATYVYRSNISGETFTNQVGWSDGNVKKITLYGKALKVANKGFTVSGSSNISSSLIGLNRYLNGTTRYYCLRIYDHVLTDYEKAKNAAVDLERFGV